MYNSYFGFSESPFENNLDQRFLFLSEDHREVLAALMYFVLERKGLALVCGDVGTGKTMLINSFLARLPGSIEPILISNPLVSYLDLLNFIAGSVGIREKQENPLILLDQIKKVLIAARQLEKDFVLIVDEAHLFPDANLEQVRLLSNIEIPESKLLQILLVGQNELSTNLSHPGMRQLRQRINISRFLSPLTPAETVAYINYRLQRVDSSFQNCFESNCEKLLYELTGGVPRCINQICDNALLSCMTDGLKKVNRRVLEKAQEALLTDMIFSPQAPLVEVKARRKNHWSFISLAVAAVFLISGIFLGQTGFWQKHFSAGAAGTKLERGTPASPAETTGILKEKSTSESQSYNSELNKIPQGPANLSSREPETSQASAQVGPTPPKSGNPVEIAAKSEIAGLPQQSTEVVADRIKPPADSAASPATQLPRQIIVKSGDTLNRLVSTWYPKSVDLGLEAILLANPETINMDLIAPGLKLTLPSINFDNQTITLSEHQFYASFGRYLSMPNLQKTLFQLGRQGVRYLVISTKNNQGNITNHILIGAYESQVELEKALKRLKGGVS